MLNEGLLTYHPKTAMPEVTGFNTVEMLTYQDRSTITLKGRGKGQG